MTVNPKSYKMNWTVSINDMINFVEPYKRHDEYRMKLSLNLDKLRSNLPHRWMVTTIVGTGAQKSEERPSRIRVLSVWGYARSCDMCVHQGLNSCWPDVPGLGANVVFVYCTRCPTSLKSSMSSMASMDSPATAKTFCATAISTFTGDVTGCVTGKCIPREFASFSRKMAQVSICDYRYP